jgi:hypothetical protein
MKTFFLAFITTILFIGTLCAQSTIIKLPKADTLSSLIVKDSNDVTLFKLNADGGFCIFGNTIDGIIPATGAGIRLMWHPTKKAFRAGRVTGAQWDEANVGDYSLATGSNTTASGLFSTALGRESFAIGQVSVAIGYMDTASAIYSTAIGSYNSADGGNSLAMGYHNIASRGNSVAIGNNSTASGNNSTAIGSGVVASNDYSFAIGYHDTASGNRSFALGNYVSTNNHDGSFIIGDYSTTSFTFSDTVNQMTMRFAGGYKLFTNSGCTLGAYLPHNATAWTTLCDRNKKENFRPIDGEQLLSKIRTMPITEWNYKGTDPNTKYIGPVAQDFYSAFHLGGTDSLGINSLCIDGVNIAAIQALEKRTAELQKANKKNAHLENQLLQQKAEQEKANAILSERIEKLSNLITSSTTKSNSPAPSVQITNNK